MTTCEQIFETLCALRAPFQTDEYDLHRQVMQCLDAAGVAYLHEMRLRTGGRIDLFADGVGIEIKKGKPDRSRLAEQLRRYAESPEITALIAVTERHVELPQRVNGKPVLGLCLNRLWGIAL